jgi:hypothetical protein
MACLYKVLPALQRDENSEEAAAFARDFKLEISIVQK